jgi:DNA-binding transcriptional MerR regulator
MRSTGNQAESGREDRPHTITRLARKLGLSRSTLLYYDSIGLLRPSRRAANGYRLYDTADVERLVRICQYRQAGLALEDIARVLDGPSSALEDVLSRRLESLNEQIDVLREQQRFIVGILRGDAHHRVRVMNKKTWTRLLAASGFTEDDMLGWHVAFERSAPVEHAEFLKFLCIPEDEIRAIRSRARGQRSKASADKGPKRG